MPVGSFRDERRNVVVGIGWVRWGGRPERIPDEIFRRRGEPCDPGVRTLLSGGACPRRPSDCRGGIVRRHWWHAGGVVLAVVALIAPVWATPAAANDEHARLAFTEVDLVSNIAGRASVTDDRVRNAWGLALSPTSPLWVANNGTNIATIYAGGLGGVAPSVVPLSVTVPGGAPTGQAFNGTGDFVVTGPGGSGPARFL